MSDRLYRLAIRCPKCGATPALKVFEGEVRDKAEKPADWPVQTVQCQRIRCGEIYTITADAYHRAA